MNRSCSGTPIATPRFPGVHTSLRRTSCFTRLFDSPSSACPLLSVTREPTRAGPRTPERCRPRETLEHLECSLQPSPPGCFTKNLSEARGNGIGVVAAGEAALPKASDAVRLVVVNRRSACAVQHNDNPHPRANLGTTRRKPGTTYLLTHLLTY